MAILTIEHLTKNFGTQQVIKNVSLSVPEHSILGFIGQNGAGKTTTMKMVLGLLRPTDGKISICGEPVTYGQTKTNRFVGYLPDVPEFYGYMKPYEYLKLCGEITGMTVKDTKQKSDELLSLVGLDRVNKKIGSFSRGMKQRLGIAQALLNNPKLLICDEPTSALDPIGRKEILDILNQVRGKTTVVFSTHILSDVERICDNIALLHDGKIALSGSLSQVKAQYKQDGLEIEFHSREDLESFQSDPDMAPFLEYMKQEGRQPMNSGKKVVDIQQVNLGKQISDTKQMNLGKQQINIQQMNSYNADHILTLHTNDIGKLEASVIATLAQKHLLPVRMELLEPTLENLFMEVVK